MTRDPKETAFESPYASMKNNPIFYNDVKGDTISYRGSSKDTEKVIKAYTDQLGKKNVRINRIFDKSGNLSGADIVEATKTIANTGSKSLNKELVNVINSKENVRIFKVTVNPADLPEVKRKGGALTVDDTTPEGKATIKEYTGGNEFKRYIFMTDKFFDLGSDSGAYIYVEKSNHWFMDDRVNTRYIPFNEALFHETIHHSFAIRSLSFKSYYGEENAVIGIINKWRVEHNIHERGYYTLHKPSFFATLMGDKGGYVENPFEYDDYTNETNARGIYNSGEKRTDVKTPNKVGKTYE